MPGLSGIMVEEDWVVVVVGCGRVAGRLCSTVGLSKCGLRPFSPSSLAMERHPESAAYRWGKRPTSNHITNVSQVRARFAYPILLF